MLFHALELPIVSLVRIEREIIGDHLQRLHVEVHELVEYREVAIGRIHIQEITTDADRPVPVLIPTAGLQRAKTIVVAEIEKELVKPGWSATLVLLDDRLGDRANLIRHFLRPIDYQR